MKCTLQKNVISKFKFLKVGGHCEAIIDVTKKYILLTFKGICMNFLLELNFFISSHPVTSKKPHKIVQILLGHPVYVQILDKKIPNKLGEAPL